MNDFRDAKRWSYKKMRKERRREKEKDKKKRTMMMMIKMIKRL